MEFFAVDARDVADATSCRNMFERDILVVPAVSFANLGQLTVDLLVNTLLQRGSECDAEIKKVGHLFSKCVPPIAGATAFAAQDRNTLCVNLEVYRIASRGITFIQQRTDVSKGKARAFAAELVAWANTSGFTSIVVITGADDMLRHDPNMQRRPLHTIAFAADASAKSLRNASFLEATDVVVTDVAAPAAWTDFRGVGIAPLLHDQVARSGSESLTTLVSFLLSCAEGDNVPDACNMTAHLLRFLEIHVPPSPATPGMPFVFPPSWSQLFGRGPDAALFL